MCLETSTDGECTSLGSLSHCALSSGGKSFSLHLVTTALVLVISCPLTVHQHQESIAVCSAASSQLLRGCCKVPLRISLLQAEQFVAPHPHPTVLTSLPTVPSSLQCLDVSLLNLFQLAEAFLEPGPWIPPYSGANLDARGILQLCPVSGYLPGKH